MALPSPQLGGEYNDAIAKRKMAKLPIQTGDLPWREAVIDVLKKAGKAMHYVEIAKEIGIRKLRRKLGATPAATVSVTINSSLNDEGDKSPFLKVDRGIFMLRQAAQTVPPKPSPTVAVPFEDVDVSEDAAGIIKALGMYWRWEAVDWTTNASLLGQQEGAEVVDFGSQKGVYLLHDGREVIYVGRASDQTLERVTHFVGRWS